MTTKPTPTRDALDKVISAYSGQHATLTIPRVYITLTGGIESALLLSQIIYWTDRTTMKDGWFAKSYDEWQEELTLSKYQVMTAVKKLKDAGVQTVIKKFNGAPTVHYKVDREVLSQWIVKKLDNPKSENLTIENKEPSQSSTETTTEITSENKESAAAVATGTQTEPETISVVIDVLAEANKVIEAKDKKDRPADLVFEAVAFHIFGIDPSTVTKQNGGRIGPIAQWLKGKSDGLKRAGGKVGFISRAAEPEHVKQFALWYKSEYPDANLPYDLVKFVESWRKWATVMSKRATARAAAPAPIAALPELTQAERDELAAAVQSVRPEWEKVGVR